MNLAISKLLATACLLLVSGAVLAEPYLAVSKGMQCSACHSHPAGGGKRNVYGNVFAQAELAARRLGDPGATLWTGDVFDWLSVGANLRANYEYADTPNVGSDSEFDIRRATIYLEADLVPNRLSLYVDEQVAPEAVENRELYLKYKNADGRFHVAAGQFFLPYGLRLEDDSAFVRQASGINFNTPDRGVQIGYEYGAWSTQLAVTNGTGEGKVLEETNQVSFLAQYVQPGWRTGVSFSSNDSPSGDRRMQNAFLGVKTGPVMWLGELDLISDDVPGASSRDAIAGLVEGNWMYRKGHNLKVSYEYLDPDRDISEDHQVRWSLLWEYSPMQFLQGRVGVRLYDGIPQVDFQNRDEFFAEIHALF